MAIADDVTAAKTGPGPGYGLPPPNTGNKALDALARMLLAAIHVERRIDPLYRPAFDKVLREPLSRATTALINLKRRDDGLGLAEERTQPGEEEHLQAIIDEFTAQMRGLWNPGHFERGGNTKTHGIVRAEFTVRDDLPEHLRRGIFAEPKTYRAWVRFSGPGPYITPDIDDVGFMSMSIKLMGVPGPKLLEDEQHTQDFLGVSTPTFVTPDTRANARLQYWSLRNAPIYYFLDRATPTSSTRSCSFSGRRRRRARSRASTSAACRTSWARGRRCSTRCSAAARSGPACRGCPGVLRTTTCARRW